MSSTAAVFVSDVSPGDRDRMEGERLRMGTERDHMREERMDREREQEEVEEERRGFHAERQRLQGELSDANQVCIALSVCRQYHHQHCHCYPYPAVILFCGLSMKWLSIVVVNTVAFKVDPIVLYGHSTLSSSYRGDDAMKILSDLKLKLTFPFLRMNSLNLSVFICVFSAIYQLLASGCFGFCQRFVIVTVFCKL